MKKRVFCIILLCVYALSLVSVSATSLDSADSYQEPSLYLYSDSCPEDAVTYAKENFFRFVSSSIEGDVISVGDSASLGSPFTIASQTADTNAYYFPVISGDRIIATFCVYQDDEGTFFGALSQYLAEELNEIAGMTTSMSPALLFVDNGNLMFKTDMDCDVLIADPLGNSPMGVDITYDRLSIVSPFPILETIPASQLSLSVVADARYLSLGVIETQSGNEWCGAYAAASIVRYVTGNRTFPKAIDVMELFYAYPTDDSSITARQACQAGEYYGLAPTYRNYVLFDTAIDDIDAGVPVYLRCHMDDRDPDEYHAIVLRGYSYSSNTLSVWNPWHSGYETMDMDTLTFVSGGEALTWCSTAHNWFKK